jgi:uncharacterized membrane protein YoaK (UPF0700 family)
VTGALAATTILQAAFLAGWLSVHEHPSSTAAHALIATSALAMGLQTAAVFRLGVRGVFSTAATATWTAFMGDIALWSHTQDERRRLGGVLVGLFAGAVAGAFLIVHARPWAPVLPLVVSASVVAVAARRLHPAPAGRAAARPERVSTAS